MRKPIRLVWTVLLGILASAAAATASPGDGSTITRVGVSRPFFNPSLGQKIGLSFVLQRPGTLDVVILDRDGFPVRKVVAGKFSEEGPVSLSWDGKDDCGDVVPDEAYSLKIDLSSGEGTSTYFPGNSQAAESFPPATSYDRQRGVLVYELPKPSRVHIQAGTSAVDPRTKQESGPCLKTIANREPRTAGRVLEAWNGFDESGSIYVPDLPHFALSLVATELPENSMIAVGNRSSSFLDRIGRRTGKSLFTVAWSEHMHHQGLETLKDVSPSLQLEPLNATWSAKERAWLIPSGKLKLRASLKGPSAQAFADEPGGLTVFVDEVPLSFAASRSLIVPLEVAIGDRRSEPHRVAVNWVSDYGPVAANSLRVKVVKKAAIAASAFK